METTSIEVTRHPIIESDAVFMGDLRAMVAPMKGMLRGIGAREPFDGIMSHVAEAEGVTYEQDSMAGVSGWWATPAQVRDGEVILYIHGGWFSWGTAAAYRNLVGQIVQRAGVKAFIPDYRLAPENPFPAGVHDVKAVYDRLVETGFERIAIAGDSAGGNLALVLASLTRSSQKPVGVVALSPVTDLALTGDSYTTRAEAEPYFVRDQAEEMVASYLNGADPKDPLASPLYGNLAGLPPILVQVGDDEVLLDDSTRYVAKAVTEGVEATLDIWEGVPHGFTGSVGQLKAADEALDQAGAFLAGRVRGLPL